MARFDSKTWNPEVFQKYVRKVEDTRENSLMKNGLFTEKPELATRLVDGVGGNYIVEPIKGLLDGQIINYDGVQNITATSRNTFKQGKVVIGRAKAWQEKDFSNELTGEDWQPKMAQEVKEYYDAVHQDDILAILKGIYGMADTAGKAFVEKHSLDISTVGTGEMGATTMNTATQKACGDKKKKFEIAFMHSTPATNLENLQLLEYLKYTDANGIQRDLTMATSNGKLIVIDDAMPVEDGYYKAESTTVGALKVISSGSATAGQITLTDVKKAAFYPADVAADSYVVAGERYTTYVLEKGFFEHADCGAKVPNEMFRDPKTNGGIDMLITRERNLYAPKYISFTKASMATDSPTTAELATGTNWEIVNDGDTSSKNYVSDKLIGLTRILSRG